jgi:hypothetical protein
LEAWKSFGYDLDGKHTVAGATDVCTPYSSKGVTTTSPADGNGGIDNAFGRSVLPLIETVIATPSAKATTAMRAGAHTILLQARGLSDDPHQTNTLVTGQLFRGAAFGETPTFTLADDWPVASGSLLTSQLSDGAKATFSAAYVRDGTWVGVPGTDVPLHLEFGSDLRGGALPKLDFVIHHATVTFEHSSPQKTSQGTIAGVMNTGEVLAAVKSALRTYSATCDPWVWDLAESGLQEASDILSDGTNRAGVPCDAISVGVGFEADEVADVSRIAADPPAAPDVCVGGIPDAGAAESGTTH